MFGIKTTDKADHCSVPTDFMNQITLDPRHISELDLCPGNNPWRNFFSSPFIWKSVKYFSHKVLHINQAMWLLSSAFLHGDKPQTGSLGHHSFYWNNKTLNHNLLKEKIDYVSWKYKVTTSIHLCLPYYFNTFLRILLIQLINSFLFHSKYLE